MTTLKKEDKGLSYIQTVLNAPKSQYNKFGKYAYRSCEDILGALKPLLNEVGGSLLISDKIELIGDRYYIHSVATLIIGDDTWEADGYAREAAEQKGMNPAQITGSTSSYARKYALNGLLAIDDTKDDDATNNHGKAPAKPTPAAPQSPPKTMAQQQAELFDVLTKALDTAPDIGMLENIWTDGRFQADLISLPEEAQATVKTALNNKKKQLECGGDNEDDAEREASAP